MRIDVSDLRTVATRLFDHLDSLGERTVDLDQDYYWVIPDSSCMTQRKRRPSLLLAN